VEFRLLGPIEVWAAGRRVPVSSAQQRTLLAVLLLHANRVVPTERLVELLWGTAPPRTARSVVQVQVSGLRRLLRAEPGADRLVFRWPGYLLRVEPGELDLEEFLRLTEQGREALGAGDAGTASRALSDALALWRGAAFKDLDLPSLRERAARLEERRLSALEDRIDASLRLGRHAELVGELRTLTAAWPLQERLHGQLMLALHRVGDAADAAAVYRAFRERLVEQLGIEPSAALQRLYQELLSAGPAVVPRQLPPDIASFTGREAELARIERALLAAGGATGPPLGAIEGPAGIGKSALAIHAAHRLAGHFPDGQLYVDLQGARMGLRPLAPLEVLGRFLRALGMRPGAIPGELEEAAAAFRSRVAGRRLLLVLDNARDLGQVAPLLPEAAGCAVLVTSRRKLAGLESACRVRLAVLGRRTALALLGRLAGGERVAAEPEAAAEVARCCGDLPLALRIAGARLAARPRWPVRALAERLADERRRLDELELAEVGCGPASRCRSRSWPPAPTSWTARPRGRTACSASWTGRTSACRWRRGCSTCRRPPPRASWSAWRARSSWRPPRPAVIACTTCCACTPASAPPCGTPRPSAPPR
jgi:DNA-binding SARP family transcriptional activator